MFISAGKEADKAILQIAKQKLVSISQYS